MSIFSKSKARAGVVALLRTLGADEKLVEVARRNAPLEPHAPPGSLNIFSGRQPLILSSFGKKAEDVSTFLNSSEIALKVRRKVVEMTSRSGSSHVGSGLSIADILAVLYCNILNVTPQNFEDDTRDRFILSKGHAAAALYATLSEVGLLSENEVQTHCADGSRLMGHASHHIPAVEFSTGSLGHGLPVGSGMALADALDRKDRRVIVLLSDGGVMKVPTGKQSCLRGSVN